MAEQFTIVIMYIYILICILIGIFIGRTDAEAPIIWPPDVKSQIIGKELDAGKD